jgi:hypothetical protein
MIRQSVFSIAAVVSATAGCSVFDASLIPHADGGPSGPAPDGGSTTIEVFDTCQAALDSASVLPSNAKRNLLTTAGASCGENPPASVSCVVDPLTGNSQALSGSKNFYFAFAADPTTDVGSETQKWHVHATNGSSPEKVALYVLGNCSTSQTCEGDTINAGIKTDSDEHLSFQVSAPGKYIVVVNSTPAPGDPCPTHLPTILLQHDVCGDGDPTEHGKSCNDPASPSCIACKKVLSPGDKSAEPNDSPLDANIIPLGDSLFRMENITIGQLGISGATGINPYDFYGLQALTAAPASAMVTATLNWLEDDPASCSHGFLAAIQLSNQWFVASNAGYAGRTATLMAQGANELPCTLSVTFPFDADPASATGLSPYLIRVAATSKVTYNLNVDLAAAGDH